MDSSRDLVGIVVPKSPYVPGYPWKEEPNEMYVNCRRLGNRIANAGLDREVNSLRIRAARGEFDGFDVVAFKVRGYRFHVDSSRYQITFASVDVVKVSPNSPGFPQAFKPGSLSGYSSYRWVTVSKPIIIRLQNPIQLMPKSPLCCSPLP